MFISDFLSILAWWLMIFGIGLIFLPITIKIFSGFFDKGYIFTKIIGIIFISYLVFLLGTIHILPFTRLNIIFILIILALVNLFFIIKGKNDFFILLKKKWKIFLFEEILFLLGLTFWSYIRSFQPDIHGLEKYMDFGFVNSILRSDFFPPKDMWFTPFPINYYYFGHLVTAVLTKLSNISPSITYNLMLSTIFALTFTETFSIGANLIMAGDASRGAPRGGPRLVSRVGNAWGWRAAGPVIAGLLTAFLVSFAGNLHILYAFFKPYVNENPLPLWQLPFLPSTFPNSYWYPNATRFIYNTIHEFPIYSFVVSDLHGHVLDIPIVLLTIAVLLHEFTRMKTRMNTNILILISFLLAVMYMTNVWDGIIYAGLAFLIFTYLAYRSKNYLLFIIYYLLLIAGAIITTLPFSLNFKPFAAGIGVLCAPEFLTKVGNFGPFLFEADHCQRSPLWQLLILYGFFYFWVVSFLVFLRKTIKQFNNLTIPDVFVLIFILLSTILIIIPEFFYIKDIYPAHYRANTMFKLVYQAFIMLSISSGYIIVRLFVNLNWKLAYWVIGSIGLLLVMIYPYFSINSYYGNLQIYRGLDGLSYLKTLYPTDYQAILWLNKNIQGQPVILEAQGDSYTDFARVSANTGLPTVLGWTVHEWLWRGTYDIPAPRISEVQTLYETKDFYLTKRLIDKYNISLVFIGDLERQEYSRLNEEKFKILGSIIYQNGQTKIYQINQ